MDIRTFVETNPGGPDINPVWYCVITTSDPAPGILVKRSLTCIWPAKVTKGRQPVADWKGAYIPIPNSDGVSETVPGAMLLHMRTVQHVIHDPTFKA